MVTSKRYVCILMIGTCEYYLTRQKNRIMRCAYPRLYVWSLNAITYNLIRESRGGFVRHTEEKYMCRWNRERCDHEPMHANSHQKLEEARKGFTPRVFRELGFQQCTRVSFALLPLQYLVFSEVLLVLKLFYLLLFYWVCNGISCQLKFAFSSNK